MPARFVDVSERMPEVCDFTLKDGEAFVYEVDRETSDLKVSHVRIENGHDVSKPKYFDMKDIGKSYEVIC